MKKKNLSPAIGMLFVGNNYYWIVIDNSTYIRYPLKTYKGSVCKSIVTTVIDQFAISTWTAGFKMIYI